MTDQFSRLVTKIAIGDRAAFRRLYAFMAMPVLRDAVRELPDPTHASAVTRSTFVELWHTAGCHTGDDVQTWIATILTHQIEDRLRALGDDRQVFGNYDAHVHRELRALLGRGRGTIRVSPRTFARLDNLDDALVVIAAGT